ncbi:glycosyltransferase [Clostridium puniceum]|nr:glycosyltransferase [Clostridium puniceum]
MKIDSSLIVGDKPLVSILLAVYKPKESWLIEQLISLNEQTYENIELLVYDDCPDCPINEEIIKNYITKFSYKLIRGTENKGSNKAFEELTKVAEGDFSAYCDQDDIWEADKLEILIKLIQKENAVLAYSDMSVIDKDSKTSAESLRTVRPRLEYIYGEKLFDKLFFSNCIAGCSMLVSNKIAKSTIPFSKVTVHDQWIAMIAGFYGKIVFVEKQLVRYRIHGNNQTGILTGIYTKKDYYNIRLKPLKQRLAEFKEVLKGENLKSIEKFYEARTNKRIFRILKYSYLSKKEAYFEVILKYMPNCVFKRIIKKLK